MAWSHVTTLSAYDQGITFNAAYNYRIYNPGASGMSYYINGNNGYHVASKGYHYVESRWMGGTYVIRGDYDGLQLQMELKNTAPTTPGAFTQPTGTLEIGDSKVITWGASTDAENNLSKYVLEASINNGAWLQIAQPTTPSFTYTVPTATSVKFRVKAADTGGLESAYRESNLLTVTKLMYYWSKYNAVPKYTPVEAPSYLSLPFGKGAYYEMTKGYTWDNTLMGYKRDNKDIASTLGSTLLIGYYAFHTPVGNSVEGYPVYTNMYHILAHDTGIEPSQAYYTAKQFTRSAPTYSRGTVVQSNITALEGTYPTDGIHTDGFWYVRGSRVSQSIAPPGAFTTPAQNALLLPKQAITLAFGASTAPAISAYEVEHRYNSGAWTAVGAHTNALSRAFTVTENKSLTTVEFRVRAKNTSNVYSDYVYSEMFQIEHNRIPTLTLETENNKTLYEKDTFVINGSATDVDIGDIVSVKYQIGSGQARAIATDISTGVAIPFNRTLTFKSGILYDGDKAVTDALIEGAPHTLKVWAEDDQGGKSTEQIRSFYVVPNRAPALTVDAFTEQSGMINNDTIKLSGTSSDPDGNDVTVKYRVNEEAAVQIHSGVAGPWSFDLSLKGLKDGENIIVVEVTDTHNFKSSKTIKLNKTANLAPLEHSVQRYKITPPSGSAQGVLLWIKRDTDQEVTAEISMTTGSEQERFAPLTFDSSGPSGDYIEDFYKFHADSPAENIVLKLSWTGDKPIIQVSGALTQ